METFVFGSLVSNFTRALPPNPITPHGALVSGFVLELVPPNPILPPNPIVPQAHLVSDLLREGELQGSDVSNFIHVTDDFGF